MDENRKTLSLSGSGSGTGSGSGSGKAKLGLAKGPKRLPPNRVPSKRVPSKRVGATSGRPDKRRPKREVKQKLPAGLEARMVAGQLLKAVFLEGETLDQALDKMGRLAGLPVVDRGFVRQLVRVVLLHAADCRHMLRPHLQRTPKPFAEIILMMGAAQLHYMRVADHAVVNSTVEMMKRAGFESLAGLTNAVMRRVMEMPPEKRLAANGPIRAADPLNNLSEFLKASWTQEYGEERVRHWLNLAESSPFLDITFKSDAVESRSEISQPPFNAVAISGNSMRCHFSGDIREMPGFKAGDWWVQDAGAALPAHVLDQIMGGLSGKKLLDLCAAPGGKTAQLASLGADVTALEKDKKRFTRLEENMARLKLSAKLVCADALDYQPEELFDAILLDAPCSATGTFRHRPDVLVRKNDSYLEHLPELQTQLIEKALSWLKPDGHLIYVTCSLQPEEGEAQIEQLISGPKQKAVLRPITAEMLGPFKKAASDKGWVRLMPDSLILPQAEAADRGASQQGNDGFFIAWLQPKTS